MAEVLVGIVRDSGKNNLRESGKIFVVEVGLSLFPNYEVPRYSHVVDT